jgi:hypothetical protein
MTDEDELRAVFATAFAHCRPGGLALFCPDHVRENFAPTTDHGGSDGAGRAMRFLEWTWDPDPSDTTHVTDYVYVLRAADGSVRVEHDRHVCGLFSRTDWLRWLRDAGFDARPVPFEHSEVEPGSVEHFLARRPR